MSLIEVRVPDIGDFSDVAVIELLVKAGDTIAVDQSLMTVESDKASMEIPSSHAGVVKELKIKLGDRVSEGSVVLMLEAVGAVPATSAPAPASASVPASADAARSEAAGAAPAQTPTAQAVSAETVKKGQPQAATLPPAAAPAAARSGRSTHG